MNTHEQHILRQAAEIVLRLPEEITMTNLEVGQCGDTVKKLNWLAAYRADDGDRLEELLRARSEEVMLGAIELMWVTSNDYYDETVSESNAANLRMRGTNYTLHLFRRHELAKDINSLAVIGGPKCEECGNVLCPRCGKCEWSLDETCICPGSQHALVMESGRRTLLTGAEVFGDA